MSLGPSGDSQRAAPYGEQGDGPLGPTRIERVHVREVARPDRLATFDLVRVVDADDDPELALRARAGDLHRLRDGTELAEPFVYHSRKERLLALVIPLGARHREIDARRELLDALNTIGTVPAYALDFRVVLGAEGLCALVGELSAETGLVLEAYGARDEDDDADDEVLTVSSKDIILPSDEDLEDVVPATAEGEPLVVRDDELSVVEGAELTETTAKTRAEDVAGRPEDTAVTAVQDVAPTPDAAPLDATLGADTGVADIEDAAAYVELLEDEPDSAEERVAREPEIVHSFLDGVPDRLALVSSNWILDDDDDDDDDDAYLLDESDVVVVPESYSVMTELPASLPEHVGLPKRFVQDQRRLRAGVFKGEVWLFAKTNPEAFMASGLDVAVQYVAVEGRAIVMLALADLTADRSETLRLATELGAGGPRALLRTLAQDFVVQVAFYHLSPRSKGGETEPAPVRCVRLRSDRESNVARILALPTKPAEGAIDLETALARALASPPPLDRIDHPFQRENALDTADEVRQAVRSLGRWLEPSRLDRIRYGLSVPDSVVTRVSEDILRAAMKFGVALPPRLVQRAVAFELASDPASLVSAQLDAFYELTSSPDRGGLRDADVASNWNALRGAAAAFHVPIPESVRAVLAAMGEGRVVDPSGEVRAANLATLLELLRSSGEHRRAAATELLYRDAAAHADVVGMALRDMRRDDVVELVPSLRDAAPEIVPVLIETLSAKKTFVRQTAALTLAALDAKDAARPLVRLLGTEPSSIWEEIARALGALGTEGHDAVLNAVRRDALPADRAALALAYGAAISGDAETLRAACDDSDPRVSAVARAARARSNVVAQHLGELAPNGTPTGPREFGRRIGLALVG